MIPPKLIVRSFISKRGIWIRIEALPLQAARNALAVSVQKPEERRQKNGLKIPFWGCGSPEF